MFIEKKRKGVSPRLLTANGTSGGIVTVADVRDLFVKQKIVLRSSTQPPLHLEIKRFISDTQFYVGERGTITNRTSINQYLVADGAEISAEEQDRPGITIQEHERAVYVEEPIVAKRVIGVDEFGRYYNIDNPLPVILSDGNIEIGTVNAEVEVQLSHKDDDPDVGDVHDSVRIGDGVDELEINPDGSINVVPTETILNPSIYNSAALTAATEYSFTFPLKTKRFMIRVRDAHANIQAAFIAGDTFLNYFTIPTGNSYWEAVDMGGKTIYYQVDKTGKIVEILYWVQP